jgi:DNA modification methylase
LIGNVWYVESGVFDDPISYEHPAVFPEALACDHILSWSNEGDLVYDPFMGSGTTAKAAHQLKRNWIGSEISQEYVDLANKRLEPYLAQRDLFDLQPEDAAA